MQSINPLVHELFQQSVLKVDFMARSLRAVEC